MLYGVIWAHLPFALSEFTEMSHEGQAICYTNDVSLFYVVLRCRWLVETVQRANSCHRLLYTWAFYAEKCMVKMAVVYMMEKEFIEPLA